MDVIDGKWIEARLSGKRGEQARLAEHMGISPHQMTKILRGIRRVQPEEIPRVISFFDPGQPKGRAQDIYDHLPADLQDEALRYLEYMLERAKTR
jgi:hypothetical protein